MGFRNSGNQVYVVFFGISEIRLGAFWFEVRLLVMMDGSRNVIVWLRVVV